jgi:hypothetical protein
MLLAQRDKDFTTIKQATQQQQQIGTVATKLLISQWFQNRFLSLWSMSIVPRKKFKPKNIVAMDNALVKRTAAHCGYNVANS